MRSTRGQLLGARHRARQNDHERRVRVGEHARQRVDDARRARVEHGHVRLEHAIGAAAQLSTSVAIDTVTSDINLSSIGVESASAAGSAPSAK
jgi:hypothetical protein